MNFVTSNLGDKLYYEICRGIIVEVKVVEIEDVWSLPEELVKKFDLGGSTLNAYKRDPEWCLWTKCFPDKRYDDLIAHGKGEGFDFKNLEAEGIDFSKCELVNQFIDIDEPVGHNLSIGDEVFKTLEGARRYARPLDKRQAHNPQKKVWAARRRRIDFINKTQGYPPLEERFPFERLIRKDKKLWTIVGNTREEY